jgi:hypothetical protein
VGSSCCCCCCVTDGQVPVQVSEAPILLKDRAYAGPFRFLHMRLLIVLLVEAPEPDIISCLDDAFATAVLFMARAAQTTAQSLSPESALYRHSRLQPCVWRLIRKGARQPPCSPGAGLGR